MNPLPQTLAGVGIDIVDIERFASAKYPERVAEYILTERERQWMKESRDRMQYLASRFAVKEAVIKAVPLSLGYQDMEICKDGVKPAVQMHRPDAQAYHVHISISHCPAYAAGMAIAYADTASI
ncbi:MAG: holo-ACP synthase [Patescibacteria group bacterium]